MSKTIERTIEKLIVEKLSTVLQTLTNRDIHALMDLHETSPESFEHRLLTVLLSRNPNTSL